ncbi:MAG: hypothetical protein JW791_02275 [Nanoarchaeota archaeon]|nr:hypothetical protein [Nanoarchaeota archaeon]
MAANDPNIANEANKAFSTDTEKPLKEIYEHVNKKEFNKASKKIKKGLQSFVNTDFKSKVHGYLNMAAQNYNGLPDNKKKDFNNLLNENSPNFDDIKNNLAQGRQVEGAKVVEAKELTELNASFNNLINYVRSNFETLKNNNVNIEQIKSIFKNGVQGLEGVDRNKIKDAVGRGFENFDSLVKELRNNLINSNNMRDAPIYGKLKMFIVNIVLIYKESESELSKLVDDLSPITSKRNYWEGRTAGYDRMFAKKDAVLAKIRDDRINDINKGLVSFTKFIDVFIEITEELGRDKPLSRMLNKLFKMDLSNKDELMQQLQVLDNKILNNPINTEATGEVIAEESDSLRKDNEKKKRDLSSVHSLFVDVKNEVDKLQVKLKDLISSASKISANDNSSLLRLLQDFKDLSIEFNRMSGEIDGFVKRFGDVIAAIDYELNDFYLKYGQDVKGLNQTNKQQYEIIKVGSDQIKTNLRNVIVPNINASDLEREKQNLLLRKEVDTTDWNKVSNDIERSKTLIGGIV